MLLVASEPRCINTAKSIVEDDLKEQSKEAIIAKNETNIKQVNDEVTAKVKDIGLPTPAELMSTGFGRPLQDHSFTQEAAGETIIFQFLKIGIAWLMANSCRPGKLISNTPACGTFVQNDAMVQINQLHKAAIVQSELHKSKGDTQGNKINFSWHVCSITI